MKYLRRLYDWVLAWADTPYGVPALFFLSFAEASIFPIPPDVLLLALCMGVPRKSFLFAFYCAIASVLGGVFGYIIGSGFWHLVQNFFFTYVFSPEFFYKVQILYQENAFWSVFISGFTPIPYKVFTISAGVFSVPFWVFVVASALGRSMRFFLVAGMIFWFGPPIKRFIDRYFGFFTILFSVLLVAGFMVVKWAIH